MNDPTDIPEKQTTLPEKQLESGATQNVGDQEDTVTLGDEIPGVPVFQPAAGLSNRHLQTVYGTVLSGARKLRGTIQRRLVFPDGDAAVIHDDQPDGWKRSDHVALLMHGLAGCHASGYMVRTTAKLLDRGVRVFRMDHRGCGAGRLLAKHPYHAGRVRDVEAAIRMLERICPGSPVSVAGFSLSANMLLRYLGQDPDSLPLSLYRAVAVCPPIDLLHCVTQLAATRIGQQYDWYFARKLINQIVDSPMWRDQLPIATTGRLPRRIIDFDEQFTAPAAGFKSAEHYYSEASAMSVLPNIRVHTTVLVSEDDPLVCPKPWSSAELPSNVSLCATQHGGHLGFIGRKGVDADNRWMDWRVVEWLLQ